MYDLLGWWSDLTPLPEETLLAGFAYADGSKFYFERAFYTQLENLFRFRPESAKEIIKEIARIVKKERKVLFVHDYKNRQSDLPDYVILELGDITDRLGIYVEDKSRGSDYGD